MVIGFVKEKVMNNMKKKKERKKKLCKYFFYVLIVMIWQYHETCRVRHFILRYAPMLHEKLISGEKEGVRTQENIRFDCYSMKELMDRPSKYFN